MSGARDVDVVIVGCGPVGAGLAILLRDAGLTVVVVERDHLVYPLPRAVMMDDEIRRCWTHHGLGPHLEPQVTTMQGAEFVDGDRNHLFGMTAPDVGPLGYPTANMFHQPDLDMMLRTVARERGAEIRLGVTATAIDDDADGVTLHLDGGDTVRAAWLIGADGASSWVRTARGIEREDLGFDQEWLVVDVRLHPDSTADLPVHAQQVCHADRPHTFVPGHGPHRRWELRVVPGDPTDRLTDPDVVWSLLDTWLSPDEARMERAAVYRFHAVVAERMRDDRVLLAGDSAHQMPPFLGQGLNSGFRDAFNLAWKLDLVHRGIADTAALDTYGQERLPHAKEIVAHAADVGRLIDQLAGRASHDVDRSSGYGGERRPPGLVAGVVSGDAVAVGRPVRLPHDPLSAGWDLLVGRSGLEVPAVLDALDVRTVEVAPDLLGGAAAVVVRPDQYVAAVADDQGSLDEHASALAAALHLRRREDHR